MVATVVAVFRVKVKPDKKLHMERSPLSSSLMIDKLMHLHQCKELVGGRCVDLLSAPVGNIAYRSDVSLKASGVKMTGSSPLLFQTSRLPCSFSTRR